MRKFYFLVLLLLGSQSTISGQATLDFPLESRTLTNDFVIIYLDTTHMIDVSIVRGEAETLRIDARVESASGKKAILDYLKKDGRYNLKIYEHPKFYATVLSLKNEIKYIFINYAEFMEKITYFIYIPEGTEYEIRIPKNQQPKQMPIAAK
jgi:hypothetical protein